MPLPITSLLCATGRGRGARPATHIIRSLGTTHGPRLVRWTQGEDGVAVVTLSNPGKLNALTVSMCVFCVYMSIGRLGLACARRPPVSTHT